MENKEKTKVTCFHCNHVWESKSKSIMVTCPSCIRKTVRKLKKEKGGEK